MVIVSWFKRSIMCGMYHLLKLNSIQEQQIKILEKEVETQKRYIELLKKSLKVSE